MGKIKDFLFSAKVGAPVTNLGPLDEVVIRYKDVCISILVSPRDGEIKSLGWFPYNELHTSVPIKDFWEARPPKESKERKNG